MVVFVGLVTLLIMRSVT